MLSVVRLFTSVTKSLMNEMLNTVVSRVGGRTKDRTKTRRPRLFTSVVCVHGQSELGVICVLMILDAMAGDDVTHRTAVHGKQQRAEYRPQSVTLYSKIFV